MSWCVNNNNFWYVNNNNLFKAVNQEAACRLENSVFKGSSNKMAANEPSGQEKRTQPVRLNPLVYPW